VSRTPAITHGLSGRRRALEDAVLTERIRAIHAASDGNYGSPNIHAELRDEGTRVGRKRVARLMRQAGIWGVSRRHAFVVTTQRDRTQRPAPDLVNRCFVAAGPNELWVADLTYVPTWAGFIFLAIVLDVWSRRIVGWSIGEQMTADLVLAALNMGDRAAAAARCHSPQRQGSQYTSVAFGQRCTKMGVRPSMGSVGDAYDNAMAESFFASLECELIDRRSFKTKAAARMAVFTYIESWYNPRRRHTALGARVSHQLRKQPCAPDLFHLGGGNRLIAVHGMIGPWSHSSRSRFTCSRTSDGSSSCCFAPPTRFKLKTFSCAASSHC
jgi:putative transposase